MTSKGNTSRAISISWFLRSIVHAKWLLLEFVFLILVVRLLGLVQPFVFQALIDRILPFQRTDSLSVVLLILLASAISIALLTWIANYSAAHAATTIHTDIGSRFLQHYYSLSLLEARKSEIGAVLVRFGELDTVRRFLTESTAQTFLDAIFAVIYIVVLFTLSPDLTWIILAFLPLQILALTIVGPFLRSRLGAAIDARSIFQSSFVEGITNIETIKSFSLEKRFASMNSDRFRTSAIKRLAVLKTQYVNEFIAELLKSGSTIFVIYFGAQLVLGGTLTFGELIAFFLISERVAAPVLNVSRVWEDWQNITIARVRLGDILLQNREPKGGQKFVQRVAIPDLRGENLAFSYDGYASVFEEICVTFSGPGLHLIVGPSGAGKSTLGRVLAGLYNPSAGSVLVNGAKASMLDLSLLRRVILYVPQEPSLFSGDVLSNITIPYPNVTRVEVETRLERLFPSSANGLVPVTSSTIVSEGGINLSVGQRQRVCVARASLSDAEILIFDEPTSALDAEAASLVMKELTLLSRQRMVVVITHQPERFPSPKNIMSIIPTSDD